MTRVLPRLTQENRKYSLLYRLYSFLYSSLRKILAQVSLGPVQHDWLGG
jgi:hypothetical protein